MTTEANFSNRTFWVGDNLQILRGINSECVDLIYLDPPFNTKRIYNAPLGSKAAGAKFEDEVGWHTIVGMKDYWQIDVVGRTSKERTGWPTQKPLALLNRVIEASSNAGDVVLDPFAGCATTCVAAELLGRQWAGVDIDAKALEVTVERLQLETDNRNRNLKDAAGTELLPGLERDETSGTWTSPEIFPAHNPPKRTDSEAPQFCGDRP